MRFTKTVVAALVLSTAMLVGCSQAPTTNATDATQDEAAVEQAEAPAQPAPAKPQQKVKKNVLPDADQI